MKVLSHRTAFPALLAIAVTASRGELPSYDGGRPITFENGNSVPLVPPPPYWNRYLIQVWQYRTEVRRDLPQYEAVGLRAFHIDRGWKQDDIVSFAIESDIPYYVDHAADKGLLHLTERTGVNDILRKKELVARPVSLSDPAVIGALKEHLRNNIDTTKKGPVLAYSFDDEISLGHFNTPAEVDASPATVAQYRTWLEKEYGTVEALNQSWNTSLAGFGAAEPVSFEDLRKAHTAPPFSEWRLAPWMDWRSFMDSHFANVLRDLTVYANELAPDIPAGFVGAQQPSAYGGYDYAKLARSVQFIEAYDIGVTNEILRSFWATPQNRPRVQTWFSNGNADLDRWFHWYYLLHGNRGAIAWPETSGHGPWFGDEGPAPFLQENAESLREIQGEISRSILDGQSTFETDPIAILYSMPSIRASWVTDAVPHGATWPNRSSSLDNNCQSAGKNRESWCKLVEDCGFQYNFVSSDRVAAGDLIESGYRVAILNRALCLSDAEAEAIRTFVRAGGTVIADHWCGLLDEHGNGRKIGALDDVFALERTPGESYFGGDGQVCELNGEKYRLPYVERLEYEGAFFHRGIAIAERDRPALTRNRYGRGAALYLNLSPLLYFDNENRNGAHGNAWREIVSTLLRDAGVDPDISLSLSSTGGDFVPIELIRWRLPGDRLLVAAHYNPSRQGAIDSIGTMSGAVPETLPIRLRHRHGWRNAVNRRTGESIADGEEVEFKWNPFEPLVIECDR